MIDTEMTEEWLKHDDHHYEVLRAKGMELLDEVKRLSREERFYTNQIRGITTLRDAAATEVERLREGIRKALIPTDKVPWTHPLVKLGDLIDVLKEMIEMKTLKKPCKCNKPYDFTATGYTLCLKCGCQYPTPTVGEEE